MTYIVHVQEKYLKRGYMHTISYTKARQEFALTMDKVIQDHTPVKVTRGDDKRVVILSEEDYDSIMETLYLFSTPTNAERLLKSMDECEQMIKDLDH